MLVAQGGRARVWPAWDIGCLWAGACASWGLVLGRCPQGRAEHRLERFPALGVVIFIINESPAVSVLCQSSQDSSGYAWSSFPLLS